MSFAFPLVLLALALVPLLVVGYLIGQRARRRQAAAFANPALLPNLVPRRVGWRRHLVPALGLLALTALLVGAAGPQRPATLTVRRATVVLAIDTSRSMAATDVHPDRLAAAEAAARTLVSALPADGRVGVVSFTRTARTAVGVTGDRAAIDASLRSLRIGGGTAIGDALVRSLDLLGTQARQTPGARPRAAIVLLSDGSSTEGKVGPLAAARRARAAGVPVYTVALGTSTGTIRDPDTGATIKVAPDAAALAKVAQAAAGRSYSARDAASLRGIYGSIGRQVGTRHAQQDLSIVFVAAAAGLVLLGVALSLRWFRSLA